MGAFQIFGNRLRQQERATGFTDCADRRWRWGAALGVLLLAALPILVLFMLGVLGDRPLYDLTRDPAAITGSSALNGALSTLGLMLWAATVGICALTLGLLREWRVKGPAPRFFFWAGGLTLLLLLDDAFLVHERVLPGLLDLPGEVMLFVYGLALLAYLWLLRWLPFEEEAIYLAGAGLLFGLSLALDYVLPFSSRGTFAEDSFKFLGIVFWLVFHGRMAQRCLRLGAHRGVSA